MILKVFKYIPFFAVIILISFSLLADPAGATAKGETTVESSSALKSSANEIGNKENLIEEAKQVPGISKELPESKDSKVNSLDKFNYLFYFIYKYKYQDKMYIEQELEEKL